MATLARVILFLALLTGGSLQVLRSPPRINRIKDEIVFQEKETFKFLCEGKESVFWNHTIPEEIAHSDFLSHDLTDRMKVTYFVNEDSDYPFVTELEVTNADPSDTGYFYCLNNGTTDHNDPRNVDSIYVYVNSTTELLAFQHLFMVMITGSESHPITLPCRPTSPDVNVTLLLSDEQVYPSESQHDHEEPWMFDPRRGFYVNSAIIQSHAQMFTCKATAPYSEKAEEQMMHVEILPDHPGGIPTPTIHDATAGHFTVGDTINLNCSIKVFISARIILKWEMPSTAARQEQRSEVTESWESPFDHYRTSVSNLVIRNASKADEGVYVCSSSDHNGKETKNASIEVKIHDLNMSYIHLNVVETITENATLNAQWVVNINANRNPVRIWRKPDGEEIKAGGSSRFEIREDRRTSVLNISGLKLEDAGVYTFTAIMDNVTKTVNLTLYVRDRPKVVEFTSDSDTLVLTNKVITMTCKVDAYPSPEIRFLFRPCLPQWNCSNSSVELKGKEINATENSRVPYRVQSKIVVKANKSGEYVCQACNPGCDNKTLKLLVSDVTDGFKLTGPDGTVVEGTYVSIACSVSLFKYQKAVTWFYTDAKGQEVVLTEGKRQQGYSVIKQSSESSYIEKLDFPNVTQEDNGTYKCQALDYANYKQNSTSISFRVLAVQAPKILNGSSSPEIRVRPGDQAYMFCNAFGIPEPTVQWYKDEEKYDGFEQDSGGESAVKFEYVKAENTGTYKCRYENKAGATEKVFKLYVDENSVSTAVIVGVVCASVIFIILLAILVYKIYQEKKREKIFKVKNLEEFLNGDLTSMNRDLAIDEQAELLPYDKQWEFPRERLKLGKQLGSGAFGRVLKAEATGISQDEAISVVAVKMVKTHANYTAFKALLSELKIMIHLGSHLNVVNLLGACTKNVSKGELFVIVEYCKFGNIQNYLIRHRDKFVNQIDLLQGTIDPSIGAERFAKLSEAAAEAARFAGEGYEVPISPGPMSPGHRSIVSQTSSVFPRESVSSEVTYITTGLSSPEDSSGQPMLNSQGSNFQAPWRSNYKGDYSDNIYPLRTQDLLCWGFQIARGMEYLASRKVLHGDLAARNVLLAENNIVKICDFGLAREVCKGEDYKKKGGDPLPVKWMAVESIFDRVFSTQSDVWSFGIVLWEIFSLGKTPYPDMQADEAFFKKIQEGYQMDCPKYANRDIYEVMKDCWFLDPRERPSFTDLQERLGNLLEASVRRHYIDLNTPYMVLNDERKASDYLDMVSSPDYTFMARPSPDRDHDYVNTQQHVNSQHNHDYLNNDVGLASNHTGGRDSKSGSDYLLMSPVNVQTPDVFSPRGSKSHFDFDFKSENLPRVDEEETQSVIELKPMLHFGENVTEVTENFVDKAGMYNGKKIHPDPTRQDSGFYSPIARSFSNPNYTPGFPFPSQTPTAEPDRHLTQNFVADPKRADLNVSLPQPIPKSSPMFTAL